MSKYVYLAREPIKPPGREATCVLLLDIVGGFNNRFSCVLITRDEWETQGGE